MAGSIALLGPVTLLRWERNEGFFKLHFGGVDQRAKPVLGPEAAKVLTLLKRGQHLVICEGSRTPSSVSMEHPLPQPSPEEVEEVLRLAAIPPA